MNEPAPAVVAEEQRPAGATLAAASVTDSESDEEKLAVSGRA